MDNFRQGFGTISDNGDGVIGNFNAPVRLPLITFAKDINFFYRDCPSVLDQLYNECHVFVGECVKNNMTKQYNITAAVIDKRRRLLNKVDVPFGYIPFNKIPPNINGKPINTNWRTFFHMFLEYGYSSQGFLIADSMRAYIDMLPIEREW